MIARIAVIAHFYFKETTPCKPSARADVGLDACVRIYGEHLNSESTHINYTTWAKGLYLKRSTVEKAF